MKKRLVREVGVSRAIRFYRQNTAALVQRLAVDPRWHAAMAVTPDGSVASRFWPIGIARIGQGGGDLGMRMQRVFQWLPPGPVVIVGTDIPGIGRAEIARAFRLLGCHDAVFGPAADGGYWLVGLRRRPSVLEPFADVRWSSPNALADTLANLAGRPVAFVATLSDVDGAESLALTEGSHVGRRVRPAAMLVGHWRQRPADKELA